MQDHYTSALKQNMMYIYIQRQRFSRPTQIITADVNETQSAKILTSWQGIQSSALHCPKTSLPYTILSVCKLYDAFSG